MEDKQAGTSSARIPSSLPSLSLIFLPIFFIACKKESERERSVYWHGMAQAGCSRQQGTESSLVSHSLLCFSAASLLHLSSLVMDGSLPPCPGACAVPAAGAALSLTHLLLGRVLSRPCSCLLSLPPSFHHIPGARAAFHFNYSSITMHLYIYISTRVSWRSIQSSPGPSNSKSQQRSIDAAVHHFQNPLLAAEC